MKSTRKIWTEQYWLSRLEFTNWLKIFVIVESLWGDLTLLKSKYLIEGTINDNNDPFNKRFHRWGITYIINRILEFIFSNILSLNRDLSEKARVY